MFALIDCNNFYVSCERVFRPDLINKPVAVCSNNDGCIIARSNETKALGIKMGEPVFKVRALCKQHQVHLFSSNYTLYRDLSDRVMSIIQDSWPEVEIYSIDEAFLNLEKLSSKDRFAFCLELQKKILQYTGIPTSIGIGPTKTLAKMANAVAKKKLQIPVFDITQERAWLGQFEVGDVWGVGRQWQKKLNNLGIHTAQNLADLDLQLARRQFNVFLQRTVMELQGQICSNLAHTESNQSIVSSCSFGNLQNDYANLEQAIGHHCAKAWRKLRKQKLMVRYLSVFIRSNPFRADLKQYSNSVGFALINPTDDIRHLNHCAKLCLEKLFKSGVYYKKCGVLFSDLIDKEHYQMDLFNQPSQKQLDHSENIMSLIESINSKYGAGTLRLAAEGFEKSWHMKQEIKSCCYTTRWSELAVVFAR
jgi:DNA polymerase V